MRKLKEETELFYTYLRQNGLKKTYQKDLILETFLNTEGHLSVEDVYALVKKRDRKVGIVTVFRTLKSLTACGIAREIMLGDGLTRFEHSYHHPHHHHIVCTECNRAIEFISPELERIQDEIIRKYHFQPLHHRFQTYGICEDCRERRPVVNAHKYDTERIFARDALKMAIAMENRCREFYQELARRNQDQEGKALLERMVSEVGNHSADLSAILEDIILQEKEIESAPVFLHFDRSELEGLLPDPVHFCSSDECRLDAKACIELVNDLNKRASDYFKAYAERFADTQGKQILLNFANREIAHSQMLSQQSAEIPKAATASI